MTVRKATVLNALAVFVFGFSGLLLLTLGGEHGILSPREQAVGMLILVVLLCGLMLFLGRRLARKVRAAQGESQTDRDAAIRHRITARKVWIVILVLLLPVAIANGVARRALAPTVTGVAVSLFMIYVAAKDIRRLRGLR